MREVGQLYNPTITAIMEHLANGETVAVAVNKGFKDASYEAALSDATVGNTVSASGLGLGEQLSLNLNLAPDYFLFTQFANGITLSDTIHSGEAQKAVKAVLNDYFKFKGNAQELTKKLTNINRFPNVDLPKEIRELVRLARPLTDPKSVRLLDSQIKKAYQSIVSLDAREVTQTRELKKAYTKLIGTIEGGDLLKVDNALKFAFDAKVNYINSTISRTEFAQAYEMSFQRQMEEDSNVIGFQVLLSSAHPRADICDFYADSNSYDMGAGIFPSDAGVNIPFHPNCLCSKVPVYETDKGEERKGRYSQQRANEYLDSLSERDRKSVIGAKNSQYKKDYEKGLVKSGFQITAKPRMVSKSILTKVE